MFGKSSPWMSGALLAVIMLIGQIGCGDGSVPVTPAPVETAKSFLKKAAESGNPIGSGGGIVMQEIEKIRATDPAKADALKKDLDELVMVRDPAEVKSKAGS